MTRKEAWEHGRKILADAGIEEHTLDAWYLLEWAAGISRTQYYMEPDQTLDEEAERRYLAGIKKRSGRIPLQHITGEQEFMGLVFHVNEHVLIPRQDTETLAELALKCIRPGMKVLDMCTGSGCIIISLEKLSRKQRNVGKAAEESFFVGVDISGEALEMARENVNLHGADVRLIQSDLFDKIEGKFDMIVSNPPYIRTEEIQELQDEVRLHDPFIALDGREDGLYFYRRIISEGRKYLNPGGRLIFETGCDQGADVSRLMKEAGYEDISVKKDLAGLDRVVSGMYNI